MAVDQLGLGNNCACWVALLQTSGLDGMIGRRFRCPDFKRAGASLPELFGFIRTFDDSFQRVWVSLSELFGVVFSDIWRNVPLCKN
jgi:hypothetical protein